MSANIVKALLIAMLLAGVPLAYFTQASGDRWFAVVAWLAFAGIAGMVILLMPVLHCPNCGRATKYFDNYYPWTDRLRGGFLRHIRCKHCHSVIDRLSRTVVARLPRDEGQYITRLSVLVGIGRMLCAGGYALVIGSFGMGAIVAHGMVEGVGNRYRGGIVLLACGMAFTAGLLLAVAGHWLRRRGGRMAEERGIKYTTRVRIRW
ncbi:MAG: hypothetical protein K6T86_17720 [Pirellulales bacterium]|nr:hypothetical protein [Pirellulales bacterium]